MALADSLSPQQPQSGLAGMMNYWGVPQDQQNQLDPLQATMAKIRQQAANLNYRPQPDKPMTTPEYIGALADFLC